MPPPPPRAPRAAAAANGNNGDSSFSFPALKVADPVTAEPRPPKEPLTARSTVRRAEPPAAPGAPPVLTAAARLARVEGARGGGGGGGGGGSGGRQKIPLEKGYSQVDWLRLTRSGGDLTGALSACPLGLIAIVASRGFALVAPSLIIGRAPSSPALHALPEKTTTQKNHQAATATRPTASPWPSCARTARSSGARRA